MRQLHPVGWKERFVASGRYVFTHGSGTPYRVELWTIHALPDGHWLVRMDLEATLASLVVFDLVEAFVMPHDHGLHVERIDLAMHGRDNAVFEGTYVFASDHVDITYTRPNQLRDHAELRLPPRYFVALPGLLGTGFVQARTVRAGEPTPHFVPLVQDPRLGIIVMTAPMTPMGEETLTLNARQVVTRVYESAHEQVITRLWLDPHDVVIQYHYLNTSPKPGEDDGRPLLIADYARQPGE